MSEPLNPAGDAAPQLLSERLFQILEEGHDTLSFSDLAERLGARAWGALLFIFAIVNVLPLPPGTNVVLAIPMLFVSAQMLLGRDKPWFPRWIDRRGVRRNELGMVTGKIAWLERRAERLVKPRIPRLTGSTAARVIGLVCLLLGLLAAVPIPVLHIAPAAGVALFGLSLIYRDGVLVIVAAIASLAAVALDALILGSGVVALSYLSTWLHR
jgi:hypothetical protein